jgi:hypothetical protein
VGPDIVKTAVLALSLVASVAAGLFVVPPAIRHWQLQAAADDPVALSQLRLDGVASADRLAAEIDAALARGDADLGRSFVALAAERGIPIGEGQRQRLAELEARATETAIVDFGQGFWAGQRDSAAGLAGALAGDLTGFGDLRDLAGEGRKWLGGEATDGTVLMLAAGGLAISAATWVSLGGALPARNGLSLVKAATKARWLSPGLSASLGRLAVQAIDRPALQATLAAAGRLELAAARGAASGIVRPASVTRLAVLGQDVGLLHGRIGQRGLRQVMAVADDAGDLGRAAKLVSAKGKSARATLALLGRGALVLGALSLTALSWMLALLGYALALAMLAQRIGWWLGRRLMPRRKAASA